LQEGVRERRPRAELRFLESGLAHIARREGFDLLMEMGRVTF
jgi:hypothetical protein